MNPFPHPRLLRLLEAVSHNSVSQDDLAQHLNVSTRTVRTDVTALNHAMVHHGAHLVHQRGIGYQLKIYNNDAFTKFYASVRDTSPAPRTSKERIVQIQILLLTADDWVKMDDLADTWNLSRAAIQVIMADVRLQLSSLGLVIESKPHLGMRVTGNETAIRARLAQLIYQEQKNAQQSVGLVRTLFPIKTQQVFVERFRDALAASSLYINEDGLLWLAIYATVSLFRLASDNTLDKFPLIDVTPEIIPIAASLFAVLPTLDQVSEQEIFALAIHIQARISPNQHIINSRILTEADELVCHILQYIHQNYPYDIRNDKQLKHDLTTHISHMIVRVKYDVPTENPLAAHIKQHYPLAYDITLAAISDWIRQTGYTMTQHEIGYLVIHIGVGLERNHCLGQRMPKALLFTDSSTAIARGLESIIHRHYPQLKLITTNTLDSLQNASSTQADLVISTRPLQNLTIPQCILSPFPTPNELEDLGKLVLLDRTAPYLLDKFFSNDQFLYIDAPIDQQQLFKQVCQQLENDQLVESHFYSSLKEREAIVSTMMGERIALPHSIELFARRSLVYTVIAPRGIDWGDGEKANLIFFMALSKDDYEEALGLYDLFLTLVNKRMGKHLSQCQTFTQFKAMMHNELV